jgi:hypothetical protein
VKLIVVVACAACSTPATPATLVGNRQAVHAAVACDDARLDTFAAKFPQARSTIATTSAADERGGVPLRCTLDETDAACVARARLEIPKGLVEIPFDDGKGAHTIDKVGWEATIDFGGTIETIRMPVPPDHIYAGVPSVKVLSQRIVPTPELREAILEYGSSRSCFRRGTASSTSGSRSTTWEVNYTCESYGPTSSQR